MAQLLTDINSNLVFSDDKAKVTDENLNNGDVAFCSEDKSIILKYNNSLYNMGGTEVADASDAVKGITKLSDAIDRDDSTVAATSKAIKTTYDEATSAKTKANEAYTLNESLTSRIEVIENIIYYNGPVIGVACTGEYTMDGAILTWIDNNFNEVNVSDRYFNNHSSFKFEETIIGIDVMMKIPLCYWWRGTIPKGPYKGKWGMLLSPTANPGISGLTFKPNYVAFMNKGALMNQFYYAKYKTRRVNDLPVSQYTELPYSYNNDGGLGESYNDAVKLAANKGTGWHLATMQEYHDILARAVVEKKTFEIIPSDYRNDFDKSSYRGIMELGGMPISPPSSSASCELMDGIRVPQGTNQYYQVFDNDGNRIWVNTTMLNFPQSTPECGSTWRSDQYFDNLFIYKDSGTKGIDALSSHQQHLPSSDSSYTFIFRTPYIPQSSRVFGCYSVRPDVFAGFGFRLAKF